MSIRTIYTDIVFVFGTHLQYSLPRLHPPPKVYLRFEKGLQISIPELHLAIPGLSALLNRQLDLRQPVLHIFLVPNTVDIALPVEARHLVSILHGIAVEVGIGFSQSVIGTLVVDADGLGRRQNTEADPLVTDPHLPHRPVLS